MAFEEPEELQYKEFRFTPCCKERSIALYHEDDSVEYTCDACGATFTAGEARRGHLYVKEESTAKRINDLEKRLSVLEKKVLAIGRDWSNVP